MKEQTQERKSLHKEEGIVHRDQPEYHALPARKMKRLTWNGKKMSRHVDAQKKKQTERTRMSYGTLKTDSKTRGQGKQKRL